MLTVTSYGRLLLRAIANSLTQSEFKYVPISNPLTRRAIQSCSYSSPVTTSNPCKLISAISGFSKFDSPIRNSSRVPPTAVSHIDKKLFGDDACFVESYNTADVLGVADGVGGWRRHGIDPSLFSKKLMSACEVLVKSGRFVPSKPSDLLANGYRELKEDKVHIAGSSTACIVTVDRNKQSLHSANLGDSGFLVVRRGAIVHRSFEQQHAFNTPYQLSVPPPEQAGMVLHDTVEQADTSTFDLELGDIILTATDGLFDNLPERIILEELASIKDNEERSVERTAWSIAEHALEKSCDPDYMSPFAKHARANGYKSTIGGKPDDITILLSLVARSGD